MLRACVLDFKGFWVKYLPLVEFAYNNSFQASIGMAPYEALCGRKCRTPICWNEVGERKLSSEELISVSIEKIQVVRDLEFEVDDMVFLKVALWKGVI